MLNISQSDREKIYNLIEQQKNGMALHDIAGQYPPKDPTVPYAVAQLFVAGKIDQQVRGDKLYCIAVDCGSTGDKKDPFI